MLALTAPDCSQMCCADTLQPPVETSTHGRVSIWRMSHGQPRIGLTLGLVSLGLGLSALFALLLLFLLACWLLSSRAAFQLPALGCYLVMFMPWHDLSVSLLLAKQ